MQIDAVEITLDAVLLDDGAGRALLDEHPGVHRLEIVARAADGETADHGAGGGDRDNASRAGPKQAGAGLALDGQVFVQSKGAAVLAFKDEPCPRRPL